MSLNRNWIWLDIWMAGVEVMVARERGGDQGWFLAAKGGHNGESHNHNDIGSFIVYADGSPLWIDAGVGTYTAKTFSPERYSIWTMQSGYHNVPAVNGIEQADGGQYRTRKVRHEADGVVSRLTVDIAPAYPADSGIRQWTRTYTLQREADTPSRIILEEAVQLAEPCRNVVLNWMCAYEPHVHRSVIALHDEAGGVKAHMSYDETMWDIRVETIALEDEKLRVAWGDTLYRLSMTVRCPVQSERWQFVLERG